MREEVLRILVEAQVHYEVLVHSRPVYTTVDAARERGIPLSQGVKTMVLETRSGKVIAALIPGDRRLSRARCRAILGEPASLAQPERVPELTGFPVGAVSPVGLAERGVRVLIDPALLRQEWVTISSGDPSAGVRLRSADLMRVLLAEVVCLSE